MTESTWWSPSPPGIRVVAADRPLLPGDALPPSGSWFVARLDGSVMDSRDGVFTEFREHVRLPDYFGWNWDALSDCLRDLSWLPGDHCLLVVTAAEQVLAKQPEERRVLFAVLARAVEERVIAAGGGVSFNVLLLASPGRAEALADEIASHRA